jgi:type II secretory pathway component GspD/PulD (secretin)
MKKLAILMILLAAVPATAQEEAKTPEQIFAEQKVSMDFAEARFSDVMEFLSGVTGIDIVTDPALRGPVPLTLVLEQVVAKDALALVLALVDTELGFDFRWGGVFVAKKARLKLLPKEAPGELRGLDATVNLDFAATPLEDALQMLGAYAEVKMEIGSHAADRAKQVQVTLRCSDTTVRDALSRMIFPADLAWIVREGRVRVVPAMVKREETKEEQARRLLKETRVNVNFEDTSLRDAMNFFAQFAGVNVYLDPMLAQQFSENELLVTLRAEDITLGNAIELICLTKGINYDFRWGGVFVGHPDRLKVVTKRTLPEPADDLPAWEKKLRRKLEQSITFSFDMATVDQALDFIRTLKGVNIVLTPEAMKKAATTALTQTVNEIRLADALALILRPYAFGMELKNEVLLVSIPE